MKYLAQLEFPEYGKLSPPAGIPSGGLTKIGNPALTNLIFAAIGFAVLLTLFYLIWAGISWITSEGDKTKLQQARSKITYAIIGLLLILFSFAIISIIGMLFNVKLI